MSTSLFICSNELFYIEHVFMHEGRPLIHKPILCIKYFWVPCIYNILNNMSVLVHLRLVVLVQLALPYGALLFHVIKLFPLFFVLSHHIFLA